MRAQSRKPDYSALAEFSGEPVSSRNASGSIAAARRALLLVGLALALTLGLGAVAQASGSPDISVSDGAPGSVLHGSDVPVSLTASNPGGQPYGYNLAFRYVLPEGVSYVGGSESTQAGDPEILANAPGKGETTLIWPNVDDLSPASSRTISFTLGYDTDLYDVGDSFTTEAGAYISTEPRDEADFNPDGTPGPSGEDSWTGSDTDSAETQITAIEVRKSEPHPEGEIPRGVHDHQTIYTLTVTNNHVNPTNDVRLEDWVPAGLEFLACAETPDHTTDAPTNPGSTQEYPGSGPIVVGAVPDCIAPDTVETVEVDPDGSGPLPEAVYTHVVWNDIGDFAPDQVTKIRYRAAIPIRENTLEWSGGTAPSTTGAQAVNLDNNNGRETYDEQPLLNGAIVSGVYQHPEKPGLPVSDEGTLLRTAEDIAIQKSNDKASLDQGDLTKWTIDLQVSEYRYVDNVTIHDVVPNGLCPLGPENYAHEASGEDSECAPVSGKNPSQPYTSVAEQVDGTYDIVWDKTTFPTLARIQPSGTRQLTFWTRTRENYQKDFAASTPILSRDSVSNAIDTFGADYVRCTGPTPDCSAGGEKIDHEEPEGEDDYDVSGSGKQATGPVLEKTVAAKYPASHDCNELSAAEYGKTLPLYGPDDMVCWKLRIAFPKYLDTQSIDVFDILPNGIEYVGGSWQFTPANSVPVESFEESADGRLHWTIGEAGNVDAGGRTFEVTIKSTVGSPAGHHSGDVEGNLLKFAYENTPGTSFALRDRVDFALALPELSLLKGVRQVNGAGPVFGPDTDHRQVQGGDEVEYRIDYTNEGDADAASSRVWDELPTGISCSDVKNSSISDSGKCTKKGGEERIEWSGIPLAAGATKTLTYKVDIPGDVSPDQTFVNTAGVVEYTYVDNEGDTYVLVPDNATVNDPKAGEPNVGEAEDPSDVYTPAASIAKTRTTSVNEGGNNKASQATIGEIVEYTVTATIPKGTTVYGAGLTDVLDTSRQEYVSGSLSGTLDGEALPTSGVSASYAAGTISASFPSTFEAGSKDRVLVLHFNAKVLDANANTRGKSLPNTATLAFKDQLGRPVSHSSSVNTTIVEPRISASKSDSAGSSRVHPGEVVDFTVKASNASGSNISTAHDVTVVDTLPVGTEPVDGEGNPVADGAAVGPQGGIWSAGARTITWTKATTPALAAIAPGGSVSLTYEVRVEDPAVSGSSFTNGVVEQTRSLDGSVPGTRTSSSSASTHGDYEATATDTLLIVLPSISKEVAPDPVTIGNQVVWHVRVTVPRSLQSYDTTVIDSVPDGFDVDGYGPATCTSGCPGGDPPILTFTPAVQGDGTTKAVWFLGDLEPAADDRVYDLELHGHLRETHRNGGAKVLAGQTQKNLASVGSDRTDKVVPSPASPPSGFDDTVGPVNAVSHVVEPKLAIDKSAGAGPKVEPGQTLVYTVKVTNEGTSPAYDVVVEDEPDSELTGVVLLAGASYATHAWSPGDHSIEWTVPGPIGVGESVTFTYEATVTGGGSLHDGDAIENTAEIDEYFGVGHETRAEHPGYDYRTYSGPDDSVVLNVDLPKLSLAKTTGAAGHPDIADAEIGQPFGWRVVVTNTATAATAYDVDVTDALPPNWEYVGGSSVLTPGADADPAIVPHAAGDTLTWSDVTDLTPGQQLVVEFEAKPLLASATNPGHGAAHPHINTAVSSADDSSGSPSSADGPYVSNSDTAKAVLRIPDLDIVKTPDGGSAVAGTPSSFTIVVENTGEATAHEVVVDDTLPAGLHYTAGTATASPSAGFSETSPLHWKIATIAPGASVTITLPVFVDAGVPDGTTLVNDAVTYADDVPVHHSDEGSLLVKAEADVEVTKVDDVDPVVAGTNLTYTLEVKNNGPSDAQDVVLADTLPSPDLEFVSADAPCTHVGNAVSCEFGTLAAGASHTVQVTAKVNPDQLATIHNTATVTTTTTDTEPKNNTDTEDTEVIASADVSIDKKADKTHYLGGETVTYTLVVRNDGPSTARDVRVHDPLPDEVSFASVKPGAPTCTEAANVIDCEFDSLAPGETRTIVIETTAKGEPPASGEGHHNHQITVSKEESYISIPAGQTASYDLSCSGGGEMVDGSAHVVDVDAGQSFADVHVIEADSIALGTYRYVVRNDTEGQAQVRVIGPCLPPRTESTEGHTHDLIVGAPIATTAGGLAEGLHSFHLSTPLGYRAVAPGIDVTSGDARIVSSEDDGAGGWDFKVDVLTPTADLKLSVRPLKEVTGVTFDHTHDLLFAHPDVHATVGPEERRTIRVSCPVGYKGIVATYDLPPGIVLLGHEPQPINRDFDVLNTTGHALDVDLDLVCVRIFTGTEIDALEPFLNTAKVWSSTPDPNTANNVSSAGATVSRQQGSTPPVEPTPEPTPPSKAPAPETHAPVSSGAPPASSGTPSPKSSSPGPASPSLHVGATSLAPSGAAATVLVKCSAAGPCKGMLTLSLSSGGAKASASRSHRNGATKVGATRYRVPAGAKKMVRVKVAKRYRALVRRKGWVKVTVKPRGAGAMAKRARVSLRKARRSHRRSRRG